MPTTELPPEPSWIHTYAPNERTGRCGTCGLDESASRHVAPKAGGDMKTTTVKAKDAPLGVQLWPTRGPEFAPNFTLASVTRELGSSGREYVIWPYENGQA